MPELSLQILITLCFWAGYLSGSVPYGLLIAKLMGAGDIRKSGSGNIGATNALRVGGKKLGILTLLCDALKGTIPVAVALQFDMNLAAMVGLGAYLGHLFPVWLKFKGGKGIATGIGVALGFSPMLGLAIIIAWLAVAFITKYSSLSALISFALAPVMAHYITGDTRIMAVMMLVAILSWAKHHENIKRLLKGEESKINLKKK